jgi:alginate O-acetyltransferase complex protein AlgI
MFFNSIHFAFFLPIVYILFWILSKNKNNIQNILLLFASYYFYACWDFRFLFLLIFSTVLDYYSGIKIAEAKNKKIKKVWFWLSISINLGFLGVFKYYNFFAESFSDAISLLGLHANLWTLKVILPVGISFYTFHGLSYVIDIYKERIKPEKNFTNYSVFVSFFPLLVAGPIERATHLLPQIHNKKKFDYSKTIDGLRQILWGLFKKVVIADNCAQYADMAFNNYTECSGSTLILGAVFFAIQIYCDFSGYSDIALGTARLFGIELLRNFAFPYFSRNIAEFWRRWHISLSTWFRDYLYIPLGGSKGSTWVRVRNTFIIFIVSGFWHGANWTFIIWGLLHALFIIPSILLKTNRNNLDIVAYNKTWPSLKEFFLMAFTFGLTVFAWIFFRSESLSKSLYIISSIFSKTTLTIPNIKDQYSLFILVVLFFIIEWKGRLQQFAIANLWLNYSIYVRWTIYILMILAILNFNEAPSQFIYFQF